MKFTMLSDDEWALVTTAKVPPSMAVNTVARRR